MTTKPILTLQQRSILQHILSDSPVHISALAELLYGDDTLNGGPDYPYIVIRTQMSNVRRAVAPHGIRVLTVGRGRNAQGYMVDPEHAETAKAFLLREAAAELDEARGRKYSGVHVAA